MSGLVMSCAAASALQLVGARVAREAGEPRLLHGDLGAGDDQIARY